MSDFVPAEFSPPQSLAHESFTLEPLGPQHNERDYAAWMSSIEHIQTTPGFGPDLEWPAAMTLEANLDDLAMHARHFVEHAGFTFTVLDAEAEVIGCVYIYPSKGAALSADVRSWVRASHAHLDRPLWQAMTDWFAADWPFVNVTYAAR